MNTDAQLKEIKDWQKKHDIADDERFAQIPKKEDMEAIVENVMLKVLFGAGRGTYTTLKVVAGVVVTLGIITGGFKVVLAWLGYTKL